MAPASAFIISSIMSLMENTIIRKPEIGIAG